MTTEEWQNKLSEMHIYPRYHSYLVEARHMLHIALDTMQRTPCVTEEQFTKMIEIYDDLTTFMEKIENNG